MEGEETIVKLKIWYYTTIKTEDNEINAYDSFPDEIEYEGKKRLIKLTKDSFEKVAKEVDYGE